MNTRLLPLMLLAATATGCQAQLFQNLTSLADRVPVGSGTGIQITSRTDGPKWLCTGDFDGDGHKDIAVTHINGEVSIVWGLGNRRFTNPQVLPSNLTTLRGVICRDFDGDGKSDLAAAAPKEGKLAVWRNLGARRFSPVSLVPTYPGARNLAAGDFNGDGIIDLAAAGPDLRPETGALPAPTGVIQLQGSAGGTFSRVAAVPQTGTLADPYNPYRPLYTLTTFRPAGATADWVAVTHAASRVLWWLKPVAGRLVPDGEVNLSPASAEIGGGVRATQIGSVSRPSGATDLLTANSDTGAIEVRLLRPAGEPFGWQETPSQTINVPGGPRSMELCDLNGDGWQDLVVAARNADRILVYRNHAGTFQLSSQSPAGRSPREMAVADFNEDGYPDFAVVNRESFDISILSGAPPRNDDVVSFQALDQVYAVDGEVAALTVRNLNGDRRDDVIQLHRATGEISVRLSGPGGILAPPAFYPMGVTPNAMAIVDYDHDGKQDLVTANLGGPAGGASSYRKGLGDGTFGPLSQISINNELAALGIPEYAASRLYGIEYGDLDDDGIQDAIAGFVDCTILLYKGLADGTFRMVTPPGGLDHIFIQFIFEARGFAIADFDQDGDNDIAAIGVYGDLGIIVDKGDLLRTDRAPLTIRKYGLGNAINFSNWTGASRSMIVRDINNDGDPDLLVGLKIGAAAYIGEAGTGFSAGTIWSAAVAPPRDFSAPVVNFPVSSMAEGDFDTDGVNDLAVACDIARCIEIQVRNGFGGWNRALRVAVPSAAFLASGDIDGDGKADLAGTGEVLWVALSGRPADAGPPVTQTFSRPLINHPVINEIMAQNSSVALTAPNFSIDAGDNPDYVEIFNTGPRGFNLTGWSLVLSGSSKRTWDFPAGTVLNAGGRLVIRCSGQSGEATVPDVWRTGWGLPEKGGTLELCNQQGNAVDTVAYPNQLKDVSYGRYHDGMTNFVYNSIPDPGRPNADNGPLAPRIDFDGFTASTYGPGQNTLFRCECRDDSAPISCTLVYWRTDIADNTRRRVLLYDDGMHDDGGTVDGIWAGRMALPLPLGARIAFYIEAKDLSETTAWLPAEPDAAGDDGADSVYRLAITAPEPSLEISEVVTRNKKIVLNGVTPDYFEIRNTGTSAVDLTGVSLSGKLFEDGPRYTFPAGTQLPAMATVLVYATGSTGPFDAPFKLDPAGGSWYLLRSTASPVTEGMGFLDRVTIPELAKNEAFIRLGARGPWAKGRPTPATSNVNPGEIVLTMAAAESGDPILTVSTGTVSGQPWQILTGSTPGPWSVLRSGTGTGVEQAVTIPSPLPRAFFRPGP